MFHQRMAPTPPVTPPENVAATPFSTDTEPLSNVSDAILSEGRRGAARRVASGDTDRWRLSTGDDEMDRGNAGSGAGAVGALCDDSVGGDDCAAGTGGKTV